MSSTQAQHVRVEVWGAPSKDFWQAPTDLTYLSTRPTNNMDICFVIVLHLPFLILAGEIGALGLPGPSENIKLELSEH